MPEKRFLKLSSILWVTAGMKGYHGNSKIVSGVKVNMATGELVNIGGTSGYPLIKAHGNSFLITSPLIIQQPSPKIKDALNKVLYIRLTLFSAHIYIYIYIYIS